MLQTTLIIIKDRSYSTGIVFSVVDYNIKSLLKQCIRRKIRNVTCFPNNTNDKKIKNITSSLKQHKWQKSNKNQNFENYSVCFPRCNHLIDHTALDEVARREVCDESCCDVLGWSSPRSTSWRVVGWVLRLISVWGQWGWVPNTCSK